jgi:hypothetical protein
VGVVHRLESNAGVIAVEVAVLDEVLDRIDNLHYCQACSCSGCGAALIPSSAGLPVPSVPQALRGCQLKLAYIRTDAVLLLIVSSR